MKYSEIRKKLCDFDIIICDHKRLFWRMIGHNAGISIGKAGQINVFESTLQNRWSGRKGVQVNPFSTWIKHYPGKVSIRRLIDVEITEEHHRLDEEYISMLRGWSYPNIHGGGLWKLICASLDFEINGKDIMTYDGKDAGIFCTQLIAARLAYCGFCGKKYEGVLGACLEFGKEFEPDDMKMGGKFEDYLVKGGLDIEWQVK